MEAVADTVHFNIPYVSGNEYDYIKEAVQNLKLSGNGSFTKKCQQYFEEKLCVKKALLTTSCTDALEMAAMLIDIQPGDEIILPSYTFVSSAIAFIRQGAIPKFVDSRVDHPGMDETKIEQLITTKTKAIIPVHYAGVACDMDVIMNLAKKYNLYVIEDAAQCIDATYKGKPLGTIGHIGCFSFHETKNIHCGEGGMLCVNDEQFIRRSEIIWEKGTNRAEFFRGEINKYGWVDIGSSFLASELNAAFLFAQLENIEEIQSKRKAIWHTYNTILNPILSAKNIQHIFIPEYANNNAHMYFIVCNNLEQRNALVAHLKQIGVQAVFHYQSLHKSKYAEERWEIPELPLSDAYSDCLLRLPLYSSLSISTAETIANHIFQFFK